MQVGDTLLKQVAEGRLQQQDVVNDELRSAFGG